MIMKKNYSDIELDKLIKEAVHEMVESATPPPLEESWARFEKKLREQQSLAVKSSATGKKHFSFFKLAAAAGFIVLLVGAFSVSFPLKARAIGDRLVNTVETLLGGTLMNVRTEYKHDQPGNIPPPPEEFREVPVEQERIVSLEEAKAVSPFPIAIPQYFPAGYKLAEVKFQKMVKDTATVTLTYRGPGSKYFLVTQMNAPDGYVEGYGYDIEDAVVENTVIVGSHGKVSGFKDCLDKAGYRLQLGRKHSERRSFESS